MDITLMTKLIEAGVGGLLIIVIIIFLKFLAGEREKSTVQHESMMSFIAEQRESNNKANVDAAALIAAAQVKAANQNSDTYVQVAEAMKGLTVEIRALKDAHLVHDTTMVVALDDMRKAKAKAKRNKTELVEIKGE